MEGRVDIVGSGLEADDGEASRRNARRRPSAIVVLPLPERGAAIIRPRVVRASAFWREDVMLSRPALNRLT